jgi:hypothetical protein
MNLLFLLLFLAQAKKAEPPPPPNIEPPLPVLAWIYPAGAARGTTVEILATGTSIVPDTVLVTGLGVTGKVADGKDPNKVKLSVTVAPDAPVGEREFRLLNAGGVSNSFRFLVGDIPEIAEVEPNNDKTNPQKIVSLPVVINGQITDSDRDYFKFPAKAGETLVLEVKARALLPYIADAVPGWFDPQLTIFDSTSAQIAFADDFRTRPDPVLFFRAPADGEYTVELRDVIYRGRGDFIYRLTIGAIPYITDIFPLGGQRGKEVTVELSGVNLKTKRTTVTVPQDAPRKITVEGFPFAAGDYPGLRAADIADPQRIAVPTSIDGRIRTPGASHWFSFAVQKGDRLVFDVQARRLGSPMDTVLTLYDAKKNQLAENDDWTDPLEPIPHNADSRIVYTFNNAGDYLLRLRDIQGKGSDEYAYRLTAAPLRPDFTLRISPDNPRMGQGDTAAITVSAIRHDEFNGEIKLGVERLPKGFIASEAFIPAGQNEGRLTITAPLDFQPGIVAPVVTGIATVGKDAVIRRAESAEPMMQAFAYTHIMPTSQLFLAVVPGTAYTLASDVPEGKVIELKPGTDTPIHIRIARKENAKFGVTVTAVRLANGQLSTKSVFVPPEKDETEIVLAASKDAKPQRQDMIVSGMMRANNQSIVRFTRAIPVVIVASEPSAAGNVK